MKKIIICGTGGTSRDILDTINDINSLSSLYECIGFLDDNPSNWGKEVCGIKVLGPLNIANRFTDSYFVNGIGNPSNFWKKESIIWKTNLPLERFETIVHPTASVSKMAQLGAGTVVLQNVTVSSNAKVGNHVVILPNTVISHDDIIGDYTCIAGGVCISGNVEVGKACISVVIAPPSPVVITLRGWKLKQVISPIIPTILSLYFEPRAQAASSIT